MPGTCDPILIGPGEGKYIGLTFQFPEVLNLDIPDQL